jgi:hypothetical protein
MILDRAAQLLGFRQQTYQSAFNGSAMQLVLVDLAKFARAYDADLDGLSHDQLMAMHGRRQMFFRIVKHLKLSPAELEQVYQPALVHAARRIQTTQGAEE